MRIQSFFVLVVLALVCVNTAKVAADIVTDWNTVLRQVMQSVPEKANPGTSSRAMAMTNGAIYDVFQTLHRQYQPLVFNHLVSGANLEAAVAQAAYRTIVDNYGEQQTLVQNHLQQQLSTVADGPAKLAGIALGNQVADKYISWREGDGSDLAGTYTPTDGPGHWQPDPFASEPQGAWGPGWGTVKTFAMVDAGQFPVPGIPDLNSPEYTAAYNEVKAKGALTDSTRTADETAIGVFWAYDRATMGPPPVMYSQSLQSIAEQMDNTVEENARLFAMASVAMADASVAAWHIKFDEDFWRPVTGIQQGDSDGNPDTVGDPDWRPLGAPGADSADYVDDFTPPFPAYVSGHATFGGALFQTLRHFYNTDSVSFTLSSAEMPADNDTRSYSDFSTAEWENAMSRVYLGIHWRFDGVDGIALGNQIADYVSGHYFTPVPEPSTVVLGLCALTWYATRSRRDGV